MSSAGRPMEEFSMAFVTAPSADKAKELASGIVRKPNIFLKKEFITS